MVRLQRLRLEFAKTGALRYLSHLEMIKVFVRACRRAGVPLVFSQGFNPHPKLSFAAPLPVGTESDAEYVDLELRQSIPAELVLRRLQQELPDGIRLLQAGLISLKAPSLMAVVAAADYIIEIRTGEPVDDAGIAAAVADVFSSERLPVARKGNKGTREVDIRPGILALHGQAVDEGVRLEAKLATGSAGNVRPEELLQVLPKAWQGESTGVSIKRHALYCGPGPNWSSPWEVGCEGDRA